ncbi:MAG: hypothetical protein KDB80_00720 [Planctomycetes bacterium]|nr:hypothetical protein [Planctomycetota bacterium]
MSVDTWDELATIKGNTYVKSVFVREPDRRGMVVFIPNEELPVWATASPPSTPPQVGSAWSVDVPGLCQTDSSGTGKWVYRWTGPVELRRLGVSYNFQAGGAPDPRDERDAFTRLAWLASVMTEASQEEDPAVFDEIYVGPGRYNGNLGLRVSAPLRVIGAGRDRTVFVGNGVASHQVFGLDSELTLEHLSVVDQGRLVYLNPDQRDGLDIRLTMRDVGYTCDTPGIAGISSRPSGPFENTSFRLEMSDCRFRVSPEMAHVDARLGMTGFIRSSSFDGGRFGIKAIPSGNPGGVSGPANRYFPDFRVSDCEFGMLTFKLPGDSYHLQVAGERWVISGCRFGPVSGSGNGLSGSSGSAGNIYSNLRDSHIIGCTFASNGTYALFFKGSARPGSVNPIPTNGDGWGNTVIGCTFEGGSTPDTSNTLQIAQVFMNVREQRFIGCSFRDYDRYAMILNQQGLAGVADGGNILIEGCDFSSSNSSSAILFRKGGQAIRVLQSTFANIDGPPDNTRQGVLVFEPVAGVPSDFDDVAIEGCMFRDNAYAAIYFYSSSATFHRLRFRGNVVVHPAANHVLIGANVAFHDLVLEDNYIDVPITGWTSLPYGSVGSSVNNTWVTGQPPVAIRGAQRGTVVENDLMLAANDFVVVGPKVPMKRLASSGGNVLVRMDAGSFDGQRVTLLGASTVDSVTVQNTGFAALGADRLLEENDSLDLVWNAATQVWCQLAHHDN